MRTCALADDMPPPYPGTTRSAAMKERAQMEPPGFMCGANFCTSDRHEYADADDAAR